VGPNHPTLASERSFVCLVGLLRIFYFSGVLFVMLFANNFSVTPGTSVQGDLGTFPLCGDVGPPLMATLNLLGFSFGLPVWLFSTPKVPYAPDASHISILYHEHQNNFDPLSSSPLRLVYPPSTSSGEQLIPSSQLSNKNKRKKNKKQGGKQSVTASRTRNVSLTFASHVGDMQPAAASHAGGKQPTSVIHAGGM